MINKTTGMLIISVLVASNPLFAMKLIPSNSRTYYKIGGASALLVPAVQTARKIRLGANIKARMAPTCSNFNPSVSIENTLNNMRDSFVGVPKDLVAGTTAAIRGYPLAKIQQSMPGMFDSMLNQANFGGNEFRFKIKTCEQIQNQVANGDSPIDGLYQLSDSQGWVDATTRAANGANKVDVLGVDKEITKSRSTYGVPWVHRGQKYSGGKGQKPIKVISDVVIAGYNLIATDTGNVVLDSLSAPDNSHANFVRFWPTPKNAADWATKVVGDISFSKDEDKIHTENGDVVAGIGLAAMLQTCPKISKSANTCPQAVSNLIWKMIDGDELINAANLEGLSSGGMAVSFEVIQTLQQMPREDQVVAVSKLSHDIAIQNLIEEALALRRILLAGFQIQEVQNLKPVRQTIKNTIDVLDKEIESLAFENRIRRELTNKTLTTILEIRDEAIAKANITDSQHSVHIANGALYTEKGDDK